MKYKSSLFAAVLFISAVLNAQIDRSRAPEPGPAPQIKIGEYTSFELKNGLKVFVVENHKIPRVAYSLVLDIDPFTEGENTGYSAITGDLLGTATKTRSKDQIDEEVDFIGASLTTSSGSIYGACLKKHNEKLLGLMSDILLNPVFNQDELDKIKKQTISSLAATKTDPSSISSMVGDVIYYGKNHPYGEITTEKSVESIGLKMCKNYYSTYFRPNIAYLAIIGDVSIKEAKKLSKKYFGEWERAEVPRHYYPIPQPPESLQVSIVDRPHAVQSVIKLGHPVTYSVGMDDYVAARVMNLLLGGTFARLDQNLREKHAYTYGVNSFLSQDKWVGNFNVSTDVRNEVTDSAVYQILYEINRICTELAPEDEVERVKNYMSGTFALALEKPTTVARFAINIARYNLPLDYYANYLKYIEEVTPEDVRNAARKYLNPENCHIFVVGKSDEITDNMVTFSATNSVDHYDVEGNIIDPADLVKQLPDGLDALGIVERYLESIGGRSKLESLTDISINMDMEVQGMNLESVIIRKAPDKFIMTMSMGGNVVQKTSFDGAMGRSYGMQGEQELSGDDLEELKIEARFMPELNFEKLGYELELLSKENLEGSEAYKIEKTDPSGATSYTFYNVNNGLIIQEDKILETSQGQLIQSTRFEDYRNVDGFIYPHKMIISYGPQTITASVTSIEMNSGIDDSVFK